MLRLFKEHEVRSVTELDGLWDLRVQGKEKKYRVPVPAVWEQHPELLTYRGVGTYERTVRTEEKGTLRFFFEGVSHTADVYLDGQKLAHHYNAYTPFEAVAYDTEPGEHRLTVVADNRFSEASALHRQNDYYTYGGIVRPVSVEVLPALSVKKIHFTPLGGDEESYRGKIEVTLRNLGKRAAKAELKLELSGNEKTEAELIEVLPVSVKAGEELTVTTEAEFKKIRLWCPEDPALYLLSAVLYQSGKPVDDLITRIGFRTVSWDNTGLKLNGKPVFLKGFNRHEDYAINGCSVPFNLMVQDVELLKDLGANAVRTCHYPNDERFLDLCDEYGLLVWEENHARGLSIDVMKNPNFDRQCKDCIDEMIAYHYNHPAIVIWGLLNECASDDPVGREKYGMQYAQVRTLDRSRPVTSATCRHFTDICLDYPDLVSVNIYTGWYSEGSVKGEWKKECDWIQTTGGKDKPRIVSEFGAGAIYGYHTMNRVKWSEEAQADILEKQLKVYLNDPTVTGVFIWMFADTRITDGWWNTRPKTENNKGVVDEFRRPKLAYETVKKLFRKKG